MEPQKPKYKHIDRQQTSWQVVDVERLIDADHPVRVIWRLTEALDLSPFESDVRSFEGGTGCSRWPARILLSAWLYGYQRGVASARELERRMQWEPGLRWLTGCEVINYHTLATFRSSHKDALEKLLRQLLVVLEQAQLVDFTTVVQDGTKIQARGSGNTVHRRESIQRKLEQARAYMRQLDEASESERTRCQAARERAARERVERLQAALEQVQQCESEGKKDPKICLTDPEARRMKHTEHGGYRHGYNVQLSTELKGNFIVGVQVSNQQNDTQLLETAIHTVEQSIGRKPERIIADNGFVTRASVEKLHAHEVELIAPVKPAAQRDAHIAKNTGIGPEFVGSRFETVGDGLLCPAGQLLVPIKTIRKDGERKQVFAAPAATCGTCLHKQQCCPNKPARQVHRVIESAAMTEHIRRMQTPEAQQWYALRSRVAEFPHMRWKGTWKWRRFSIAGLLKATTEALWMTLAYNFSQWSWALKQTQLA